jgi:hypothetical protein
MVDFQPGGEGYLTTMDHFKQLQNNDKNWYTYRVDANGDLSEMINKRTVKVATKKLKKTKKLKTKN